MPKRRILVVEDDQTLREVIAQALREDGYNVDTSSDGEAALRLAARSRPDLVILDLMMPRMNGEQFCSAMRQLRGLATVPIILVSAARAVHEVGARVHAATSLLKPFDLYELTARVDALLRSA